MISEPNLRAVRSVDGAFDLLALLGYDVSRRRTSEATTFGLAGTVTWIKIGERRRVGYAVLVAEVDEMPPSLRRFGRLLVEELHDHPLAVIGVRGPDGWPEFHVIRPKLIGGSAGAVAVSKLRVDAARPSRHDVEVIRGLGWNATKSDVENWDTTDAALDVQRITRKFFRELNEHHIRLVTELRQLGENNIAARAGLIRVHPTKGAERVGLRILTQTLFCYFLQRKGLLQGDPQWLSKRFRAATRNQEPFYPVVMENLFYAWLNTPEKDRTNAADGAGVPFLNGGLFERLYGDVSLPLPDALFSTDDGLLGFLDGWSFTVSEDTAEETEVAVDPEMLGKVFENLLSEDERKREGTVYTPRPVVQFMCREALVPWLQRQAGINEPTSRLIVAGEDPYETIRGQSGAAEAGRIAAAVDLAITQVRVLDPAVGSGAFLLGMLAEIVHLRRFAFAAVHDREPSDSIVEDWKLHAIEHNLEVVPVAVELRGGGPVISELRRA